MPPTIVLYDGDCRFCRYAITRAWRWADDLVCLPFDDPRAARILNALPPAERRASFHAVAHGRLYSGTAAFAHLLRRLPAGHLLCALGAHRLYPVIVAHRRGIGRYLPDVPCPPAARR